MSTTQEVINKCIESGIDPKEFLASYLMDVWFNEKGRLPWATAVKITAIVTKMPDQERDRLLALQEYP